jgi:murein DD-endopeptidase MepM/ murein hydrolase activator NlpD
MMTFGAMAGVGALLVSTSLPANAFYNEADESANVVAVAETQSVTVQESTAVAVSSRDGYTVVKPKPKPVAKPAAARYSAAAMIGSYTNNSGGSVQWPFPSSPITSGFGMRSGGHHNGLDFTPGAGTPIGSIADGVVIATGVGGAYGNSVSVEHVINGQTVRSLYAHMQYGSIGVAAGQHVTVGTYLGAVGSTGRSTGAHLHLEISLNGVSVDPYAWLKANAN